MIKKKISINVFGEKNIQKFFLKKKLLLKIIYISKKQQFKNIFYKIKLKKIKINKCFFLKFLTIVKI